MSRLPRSVILFVPVICVLCLAMPARAGGNMEDGWVEPHGLNNRYWDPRLLPMEWRIEPNPQMGYDETFVLPELLTALRLVPVNWRTAEPSNRRTPLAFP